MGAGCASWFWGMAVGFFRKRGLVADFSALIGSLFCGFAKMSSLRGVFAEGGAGYGEADSDPPLTVCGRSVLLDVVSFLVGDVSPRTWRRIGIRLSIGIVALSRHRGGGATGPGLLLRRRFCLGLGLLWRRIGIRLSIGLVALSRHRGGGATGPGGFLCQGVAFVWDWVLLWRRIGIRLSIGGGGFEFVFFWWIGGLLLYLRG